jgi:hypothetical protein
MAVPDFALDAVKRSETYQRMLTKATKAVLKEVGGKVTIDGLVNRVSNNYGIDRVVVHTAISRLLRNRQLRAVKPDFVAKDHQE